MIGFRPNKPTGTSAAAVFMIAVWEYLFNGKFPFGNSDTVKVNQRGGVYYFTASPPGGSGGFDDWAKPIVWDRTKSYKRGQVVVIRPTDLVVVAGYRDKVSGLVKKSVGGIWKCTQDVNPSTTPAATNVPQWPLPTSNNPDGTNVYWFPMAFYPQTTTDCAGDIAYIANAQPPSS